MRHMQAEEVYLWAQERPA